MRRTISRFLAAVLLVGCGGPDETGPDDPGPDDTDTPSPGACAVASIGLDGGTVQADGASVDFGPGAFVAPTEVTLCREESTDPLVPGPIWVLTPETELASPATLAVEHTGDEQSSHLFVPYWEQVMVRAMQEERPAPGVLSAPIYRLGRNWVASDPRVVEPWGPSDNESADLLFVVDNSTSAGSRPAELAALAPSIVAALDSSGLDYQVGVVTTDLDAPAHQGRLRQVQGARWIDPKTPDPSGTLALLLDVGSAGSDTEQGIGAAYLALGEELAKTDNADFERYRASLAVVFVADEDDETSPKVLDPATLPEELADLKSPWASAVLHGIVPATGTYAGVIDASGGTRIPITSFSGDWLGLVEGVIDTTGLGDGGLVLSQPAVRESIQVWWVPDDEEPVWLATRYVRYDSDDNEVRVMAPDTFSPDELVVLYEPE